jgi:hypothetical protein
MSFLDRLERAFGRFAIPGITLYLVIGQVGVFFLEMLGRLDPSALMFVPILVRAGEPWRLATFLLQPPTSSLIFIAFAWWVFYFMGSALEAYWGAFRYNLFLLLGYGLTVGTAFFHPGDAVDNEFLAGSVFLAFAYLNPEFEMLLFFILPLKIRWMALVAWAMYAAAFILGGWPSRLAILAAVGNFFIFFGPDLWRRAGLRTERILAPPPPSARTAGPEETLHRCRICGKTDRSDPQMDFRYCSKCAGSQCYCPEHIFSHEHVAEEATPPKS